MDIRFTFINRSHDQRRLPVFLCHADAGDRGAAGAVAWKVIRNCAYDWRHPFVYKWQMEAGLADSFGNYSPRLAASCGQVFAALPTVAGRVFRRHSGSCSGIAIVNKLAQGAVHACLFNEGRLLACHTNLAPGQTANFRIPAVLRIGAAPNVQQGQLLDAEAMASASCEIPLLGLASADIVMTGGGGSQAPPLSFHIENIVKS